MQRTVLRRCCAGGLHRGIYRNKRVRKRGDAMAKFDEAEYRAHAAECQRMADASAKEADKRQWQSLAQSWLELIRTRARTPNVSSDAESGTRAAGQKQSKTSH
jgi:hypothetical protein